MENLKIKGNSNAQDQVNTQEKSYRCFVSGSIHFLEKKQIKEYFEQFGEILDILYPFNKSKNLQKGYVVIQFKEKKSYLKVLEKDRYFIQNIPLKVEDYLSLEEAKVKNEDQQKKKLFVKGLPKSTSNERLETFFKQFGKVNKIDKQYGKKKGKWLFKQFAFVIMEEESGCELAIKNPNPLFYGKKITIKRAVPKTKINSSSATSNQRFEPNPISNPRTNNLQNIDFEKEKNYLTRPTISKSIIKTSNLRFNIEEIFCNEVKLKGIIKTDKKLKIFYKKSFPEKNVKIENLNKSKLNENCEIFKENLLLTELQCFSFVNGMFFVIFDKSQKSIY